MEQHLEPQVRLVGPIAPHRFLVRHPREGNLELDPRRPATHMTDHPLDHRYHLVPIDKGHLQIDLREFRLPVVAQVLVTEAPGNLIVAIRPTHHEHLLEELGRLREGEETPWIHATGHQVISRALRRAFRQDRRFNFQKALRIPDDLRDPEPIPEVDEKKAAVIAPVLHPSHQMDALADLGAPKLATRMRARGHDASFSRLAATAFTCRISASVRNRYSPRGS